MLRWKNYPGLFRWSQGPDKGPGRKEEGGWRVRVLVMQTQAREHRQNLEARRQGIFSPRASERSTAMPTPSF